MSWTDLTQLSNLMGWYKSESLSGYANGDPIDSWSDSSGNGYDLSASGTLRPTKLNSAINGNPGADFSPSNSMVSSAVTLSSSSFMILYVAKFDGVWNYQTIMVCHDATTPSWPNRWFSHHWYANKTPLLAQNDGTYRYAYALSGASITGDGELDTTSNFIGASGWSAGAVGRTENRLNGKTQLSGIISDWDAMTGTGYFIVGDNGLSKSDYKLSELVVLDWNESFEEVWIEGYLSHKYGITLPDGHLFKNDPPSSAPPTYNPSGGLFRVNLNGGI